MLRKASRSAIADIKNGTNKNFVLQIVGQENVGFSLVIKSGTYTFIPVYPLKAYPTKEEAIQSAISLVGKPPEETTIFEMMRLRDERAGLNKHQRACAVNHRSAMRRKHHSNNNSGSRLYSSSRLTLSDLESLLR